MQQPHTTSFDGWVLRRDLGELAKDGRKIRLQDQPLQILDELLSHPGELVTRDQLIARLWPKGVVDFDTGLNSAVRKLRVALQDEADTPRYIETVPRKGYRFIGTVDPPAVERRQTPPPIVPIATIDAAPSPEQSAAILVPRPANTSKSGSSTVWYMRAHIYVAAGVAALVLAGLGVVGLLRQPVPTALLPTTESPRLSSASRTLAVLPFRTSASDEASQSLAQGVTGLLHDRLASIKDLVVIAGSSTSGVTDAQLDAGAIGRKLHARYLLQGSVDRTGDELRMKVQFVDAASGSQLWSTAFDRSLTEVAATREEIVQRIAGALHIAVKPAASNASIDLDVYQLYLRGQQLMSSMRVADAEEAVVVFSRITALDPGFARGYLGLGQALLLADRLRGQETPEAVGDAEKAFERALELNPALGEAWIECARLTETADPAKAEELFRKGLQLAPSYGVGYSRFAEFLFRDRFDRRGEAIAMIDRARQIDPLTPQLHQRKAFFLMVSRSDVAGHDRLLQEALAINPDFHPAMIGLAESRYFWSGEFAQAIRFTERAIALDPQSDWGKGSAASVYLDVDDPVAAMAVLRDSRQPTHAMVEIAQYQRDPRRAAELARSIGIGSVHSLSPLADAIRDEAIVTGDYASAVKLLESSYSMSTRRPMLNRGVALVYAHTLILAGETQRGRRLATSLLVHFDTEAVGRTKNWFARERAAVFAMLGEDERALKELAASLKLNHFSRWWYTAELDPLYDRLRRDPRFQGLAEQTKEHRNRQRALVEQMRRRGEVPKRGI